MLAAPVMPYVKQSRTETGGGRTCGAACLSMVYSSLGTKVSQEEIWPHIAKANANGSLSSTTHLMAKDAIERGFDAVVIQASRPLRALRACLENGLRVIINHRLDVDSPVGHYSVLSNINRDEIFLHDPLAGPSRCLSFKELLEIWRPVVGASEIVGHVLIAIGPKARRDAAEFSCPTCRIPIPPEVACPKCQHAVALRPYAALGCVGQECISRMWRYLCCPECDCAWAFHGKPAPKEPATAKPVAPPQPDPLDVDHVYSELDKLINLVLDIPGAAEHSDIRNQIEYIYGQKETLRMAIAESAGHRQAVLDQCKLMMQTAKMNEALQKKRVEDAARQSPPLDGDALGMALLRNLGFVR